MYESVFFNDSSKVNLIFNIQILVVVVVANPLSKFVVFYLSILIKESLCFDYK